MAEVLKKLGQSLPSANTLTNAYTVPAARSAAVSSILVCNQGASSAKFRISHAVGGATDALAQYLYYDDQIPAKKTFAITLGIALAATDVIRVLSDTGLCSFNIYGAELS